MEIGNLVSPDAHVNTNNAQVRCPTDVFVSKSEIPLKVCLYLFIYFPVKWYQSQFQIVTICCLSRCVNLYKKRTLKTVIDSGKENTESENRDT